MKHIYEGKTKTVYQLQNGNYYLVFKDDATGENGKFDPGANSVGLCIDGMGKAGLQLTEYFFNIIESKGIQTHFVRADLSKSAMEVLPAKSFGNGVEAICRLKATGSFMRRFGAYAKEGQTLNNFFELTLKDDERGDPIINEDAAELLGIMDKSTYQIIKGKTKEITTIIKETLLKHQIELYDIKLEFGLNKGEILLIDEISGGNMRAYKNEKQLSPLEIAQIIFK